MAHRAQQDCIAAAEPIELGVGQDLARTEEPLAPQIERSSLYSRF